MAKDAKFKSVVPGYNNLDVGDVLQYQVTGLTEGTEYFYRIRAYKDISSSQSGPSEVVSATTLSPCVIDQPQFSASTSFGPTVTGQSFVPCASGIIQSVTVYSYESGTGSLTLYKGESGFDPADQLYVKTGIGFNADAATVIDLTDGGDGEPTVSSCQQFHFKVESTGGRWVYSMDDVYPDGKQMGPTGGFVGDGDLRFQVKIAPVPVFGVDVDYIAPNDGISDVGADTDIVVQFNEPICDAVLDSSTFEVRGSSSGIAAGAFSVDNEVVTFVPDQPFVGGEKVTVTLDGVESTAGHILTEKKTFSFTIIGACDISQQKHTGRSVYTSIGQSFIPCTTGRISSMKIYSHRLGTATLTIYRGASGFRDADEIFTKTGIGLAYDGNDSHTTPTNIVLPGDGTGDTFVNGGSKYHFKLTIDQPSALWLVNSGSPDPYPDGTEIDPWGDPDPEGDLMFSIDVTPTGGTAVSAIPDTTPAAGATQTFAADGETVARVSWDSTGTPPDSLSISYKDSNLYPSIPPDANIASRIWSIDAEGGSDFTATIRLYYDDADIAALSGEDTLQIWKTDNDGGSWEEVYITDRNVDENWIEVTLTSFSDLVLAEAGVALGPPAAPADLAALPNDSESIDLSWTDRSSSEEKFVLEYSESPAGPFTSMDLVFTTMTETNVTVPFSHTGLECETAYYYRVRAENDMGASDTTSVDGTVTGPCVPTGNPPDPLGSEEIEVVWDDNSTTESGFVVEYRMEGDQVWQSVASPSENPGGTGTQSLVVSGLLCSSTYEFRVKAVDAQGEAVRAVYSGDVSSVYTPVFSADTAPCPPEDLASRFGARLNGDVLDVWFYDDSVDEEYFLLRYGTVQGGPYDREFRIESENPAGTGDNRVTLSVGEIDYYVTYYGELVAVNADGVESTPGAEIVFEAIPYGVPTLNEYGAFTLMLLFAIATATIGLKRKTSAG